MEENKINSDLDKSGEEELIVGGYVFSNEKDAQEALREQKNIVALKEKIDFNNPEEVIGIYNRLVEKKVFKTPVGLQFLGEFRDYLIEEQNCPETDVPYISVPTVNGLSRMKQEQLEFLQSENQKLTGNKKKYVITIGVLIGVIVVMFLITALNPNVGYINTENKILNRYAGWEEELNQRETEIREREEELGITPKENIDTEAE